MSAKGICSSRPVEYGHSANFTPSVSSELDKTEDDHVEIKKDLLREQTRLVRSAVLRGAAQMISCRTGAIVGNEGSSVVIELPIDVENTLYDAICIGKLCGLEAALFQQQWTKFASNSKSELIKVDEWEDVLCRGILNHQSLLTGMDMVEISSFLREFVKYVEGHDIGMKAKSVDGNESIQWIMLKQLSELCSKITDIPQTGGTVAGIMLQESLRMIDSGKTVPFLFPIFGKTHIAYLVVQKWFDYVCEDENHKLHQVFLCSVCNGGAGAELFSNVRFSHETNKAFTRRGHCIVMCSKDEVMAFTDAISHCSVYNNDEIFANLSKCITEKINDVSCICEKLSEQDLYDGKTDFFPRKQVYLLEQIVGNCPIHNLVQALKVFIYELFPSYNNSKINFAEAEYSNAVMLYNIYEVCLGMIQENREKFNLVSNYEEKSEARLVESVLLPFLCEKFFTILLYCQASKGKPDELMRITLESDVFCTYHAVFKNLVSIAAKWLLKKKTIDTKTMKNIKYLLSMKFREIYSLQPPCSSSGQVPESV